MKLFDNGGKTLDRYTLITERGEIYCMDEQPTFPTGIGQYLGQVTRKVKDPELWAGDPIDYENVPKAVQDFIDSKL